MNNVSGLAKVAERVSFIQESGSSPASKPYYRGETSYDGWDTPQGDVSPDYLPSRGAPNQWDIVDTTQTAQGLPTTGFTSRVNDALYKKWRGIIDARCPFAVYAKKDDCGRKDDLSSWQWINIYVETRATGFTDSVINPLSGDDQTSVEISGSLTGLKEMFLTPIKFEEVADTTILANVLDGFYKDNASCGGKCGQRQDKCHELFVLTALDSASLGLSSQLVFSVNDKQTFSALDIPTLGGVAASAIGDAGSFIIVISENEAAHNYISFTDAKALDTSGWTKVSASYVEAPIGVYVKSPEEIFLAGNAGYAYKLEDVTSPPIILTDGSIVTDDLRHVDGVSSTIIFAGDAGKVLVSQNDGDSLTEKPVVVDGTTLTGNITALAVTQENIWFVAIGGKLYYTLDTGDTYTEKSIDAGISVINDIRFYEGQIGYLSIEKGGSAKVYRSYDAGYSWNATAPSIAGLPTANRISAVIPCGVNEVAAGGQVSSGGDGVLAIAQ